MDLGEPSGREFAAEREEPVSDVGTEALARGLLQIADLGGMPDTFWQTDSRVELARAVLGVPSDGRYTHAHLWDEQPT